ncbi:MAG: extracellular solute-binding protein [candidate division NC10 bacterium]|nr:extracellular solute-binding protein [candidate division NC10 bacterium]
MHIREHHRWKWASVGAVLLIALLGSVWLLPAPAAAGELVVYSGRKEELIRPAIQAAQKALNVKITLFTAGAGELARPDNTWVPITARVRVLMTNSNLVRPQEAPRSYFELTDPRWKGKIAIASMGERTTVGWLAAILAVKGEEFTKKYVAGLRANGLKVLKNNTEVRKAVAGGEYAVGITNHYYYLLQLQGDPKSPLGLVYPDQGPADMGTPVFSITAALIKGAKNAETGRSFLEFLLNPEGNRHLVEGEFEIPLIPGLHLPGADKGIKGLGQFKRPSLTQAQIADLEPKVERLFGSALTP